MKVPSSGHDDLQFYLLFKLFWQRKAEQVAEVQGLADGLRESPGRIAFARENSTINHTYTVTAPDPFVAPYHSFLPERTPKEGPSEARIWRKDEYPN